MNKEDKKLQKHLVDEMMKTYKTNPDVMYYMEALMKYCLKIEQENDRLNNIIEELEKELKKDMEVYLCGRNNRKTFRFVEKMVKVYYLNKLKELKEKSDI